jgi:hypothetical protein
LDRDEATGACLFGLQTGTDEYEQPVFTYVAVGDCKELDGTWDLGDGVIVTARCADCGCDGIPSLCCGERDLSSTLKLRIYGVASCGDAVLNLTQGGDGVWTASGSKDISVPDAGGEICVPYFFEFRFFCDPAGPVHSLGYRFTYLGNTSPAEGYCGAARLSEDCECPYLGLWQENVGPDACANTSSADLVYFEIYELEEACA